MNTTCPWCESKKSHLHLQLKDYFLTQEPFEIVECDDCHLLYTTPRPTADEIGRYYQSENYYSHQENKKGFVPRLYEAIKRVNIKHKFEIATEGMNSDCGRRILEIGCGVGDFLHYAEQKGWECYGAEPSDDAVKILRTKSNAEIVKPEQIEAFHDASFDLICMWHVLEHVDDLKWQIAQLGRLVKPNGKIVIALPNYQSYDAQFYKEKWAAYDVPRHLNHFSEEYMRNKLNDNKLVYIKSEKLIWDSYYISYLSEQYCHHKMALLRGAWHGFVSNQKARKSGQYSSLVYLFKKC